MPLKNSLYKVSEHSRDNIANKGYDYEGKLFEKTMSKMLFFDSKRANILSYMEKVMHELIQRTKQIKIHFDFAKQKDYRDFN